METPMANKDLDELKSEFKDMREDVKEMKNALLGNKFTNGKGIIQQYLDLQHRVEMLEKWKMKYTNIIIGLSIGSGIGLTELFRVFYAFLTAKN